MGFSQGLSGLNAASQALDVVGNNIANSQTVGFKSGSITFGDVFAGSQVGMGVQVLGVNQNFGDGILSQGNSNLSMGIQGNGFFRLTDAAGKIFYSRNGEFTKDADGFITNNGLYLTGYQATGTPPSIQPGSPLGPIQIPDTQMPAKASTSGSLQGNLNSSDDNKVLADFDASDASTYNFASVVEAYDSLGNKHTVDVYYIKTADNQWTVKTRDTSAPGNPEFQETTLQFNSAGELISTPAEVDIIGAAFKGGDPLNFKLDLSGMTQQASDTAMEPAKTDGYEPGKQNGYTVGDNGQIIASYSNGQQQLIGQVVLSNFTNPGGLASQGNNTWSATPESGQATNGLSGTGNLGKLHGSVLEASNVDLGKEMVNMIVYQRNYQSNSQTIKTQSELLQTLSTLR